MKNNVTNVQKYIWLDQILDNESPKYNIGGYAFINGSVDVERFKTAFNILIKENDIFSFVFEEKSGFPVYSIQEANSDLALTCIEDWEESKAIEMIGKDFVIPFGGVIAGSLIGWLGSSRSTSRRVPRATWACGSVCRSGRAASFRRLTFH